MNHFSGLIILALGVATVFALIAKENRREQWRYFFKLLAYMILGSLAGAWVMSAIPW